MRDANDMLAHDDRGRGVPLVFLHGFPVDRRMWNAQVADLSSVCRIIAVDLPGFGQSPKRSTFSIEDLADAVYKLLKSIDALPCVLAGWSMGGYTALALARKHLDALRGLILIDTKAEPDNADQKAGRAKMIELVRTGGATAIAEQMIPKQVSSGTLSSRPAIVRQLRELILGCDPKTIENGLAAMRDRCDQTDLLPLIRVPTSWLATPIRLHRRRFLKR
jgi:3-oxoadipate enol-lactonase